MVGNLLLAANIVAIVLLALSGYSDYIDPREHAMMAAFGLAMPIVIAVNVAFLIVWLLFKKLYAIVPLAGFVICWGPVRRYCPINAPSEPPEGALKIISYNVRQFCPESTSEDGMNPIVDYLANSGADIICLQESGTCEPLRHTVDSTLAVVYQYRDTVQKDNASGDVLSLYSKFPILGRERVRYESRGNLSEAYTLDIRGRKTLLVNNHFETAGLSPDDKRNVSEIVHGEMGQRSSRRESKFIIGKVAEASRKRAPQADAVAKLIARYRRLGMGVIVCGDFNDTPISYTHRTVAKGLTDCYVSTGIGPGWSFHNSGIRVRIDNILCSSDWQPYGARVDRSIATSDHYPIVCWLKKR